MKNPDLMYDAARKKRITSEYAILIFALSAIYAVVLTPLFSWTSSDILIRNTGVSILFETLLEVFNYLFYWVTFAYFLWMTARFSQKENYPLMGICAAAILFRYGTALLGDYLLNGFPEGEAFLEDVLPYLLTDIFLDALIFGVAILLIYFVFDAPTRPKRHGDRSLHTPLSAYLPFSRVFAFGNPLLRVSLAVAALPSVLQIVYRLIYDITFFGPPRDLIDLLWIVTYYLLDVITAFIGFFVLILLLNRAYLREEKAYLDYSED